MTKRIQYYCVLIVLSSIEIEHISKYTITIWELLRVTYLENFNAQCERLTSAKCLNEFFKLITVSIIYETNIVIILTEVL